MEGNEPLHIYYDGECGVCSRIKERLGRRLGEGISFHNIRTGELPPGVSLDESIDNVHAFDGERLSVGGDVVFALLRRSKWWRWAARLERIRSIRSLVRWCYRLLANHRPFFSHFI